MAEGEISYTHVVSLLYVSTSFMSPWSHFVTGTLEICCWVRGVRRTCQGSRGSGGCAQGSFACLFLCLVPEFGRRFPEVVCKYTWPSSSCSWMQKAMPPLSTSGALLNLCSGFGGDDRSCVGKITWCRLQSSFVEVWECRPAQVRCIGVRQGTHKYLRVG